MSRKLDDLAFVFKPIAFELLARFVESGYSIMIIDTRRTIEEHQKNLATGRSWIKHSKHIDGLAIDICPYDIYRIAGADKLMWDAKNPVWKALGEIGERISGIKWGGHFKDFGHFEYSEKYL